MSDHVCSEGEQKTDHFIASAYEDCDRTGVGTFFNNEHLVAGRAECDLPHNTCLPKFLRREILESGDDSTLCCYGDQLRTEPSMMLSRKGEFVIFTSISGPPTHRTAGSSFCINK